MHLIAHSRGCCGHSELPLLALVFDQLIFALGIASVLMMKSCGNVCTNTSTKSM